jgi:hypothetical protein
VDDKDRRIAELMRALRPFAAIQISESVDDTIPYRVIPRAPGDPSRADFMGSDVAYARRVLSNAATN